jgi:hypothetical protein
LQVSIIAYRLIKLYGVIVIGGEVQRNYYFSMNATAYVSLKIFVSKPYNIESMVLSLNTSLIDSGICLKI